MPTNHSHGVAEGPWNSPRPCRALPPAGAEPGQCRPPAGLRSASETALRCWAALAFIRWNILAGDSCSGGSAARRFGGRKGPGPSWGRGSGPGRVSGPGPGRVLGPGRASGPGAGPGRISGPGLGRVSGPARRSGPLSREPDTRLL